MTRSTLPPQTDDVRPDAAPRDVRRLRGMLTVVGAATVFGVLAALVRLSWTPLLSVDSAVARDLNAVVAGLSLPYECCSADPPAPPLLCRVCQLPGVTDLS